MKEQKLRIIIILMSISVLGLITAQVYWLTKAYEIERRKFHSDVRKAVNLTINKFETKDPSDSAQIILKDTVIHDAYWSTKGENYLFKFDTNKNAEVNVETNVLVDDDSLFNNYGWNVVHKSDSLIERIVGKAVKNNSGKTSSTGFNKMELDSLLKVEFSKLGIENNFRYLIKISSENNDESSSEIDEDDEAVFKFELGNENAENESNFVMLTIPDEESHVLTSMWGMFTLSIIFIVIIIFLFSTTIKLLLKQKKISEIKNDFINNFTHEFNTPIASISLACDTLKSSGAAEKPEELKYLNIIKRESKRLNELVESILNSAVLENKQVIYEKEKLDVHEIIKETVSNFTAIIDSVGGNINLDLQASRIIILADKLHLKNALGNVIDNAIKYSREDLRIDISTHNEKDNVVIKIKDNGIGIKNEERNKIFDTFYRVPSGNIHTVKGFGIGLSYSKKTIEEFNGSIIVNSKLNKGSEFIITLPVYE